MIMMIFFLGIFCNTGFGAEKTVSVNLPRFSIYLNGTKVNPLYHQYPLITYKDITYFPMTYHGCRFLGLETKWQTQTGLEINKNNITAAYREDYRKAKNMGTYSATIPTFPIKVNGKLIDNTQEEYPLLLFRDVTYFPLTWRFAVEEFGWDYSFDTKKGLVIQSANQKLQTLTLPNYEGKGLMIMDGGFIYQGKEGGVYHVRHNNPEKAQKIYQLLPSWIDDKVYTLAGFYKDNGEYFMTYHTGGATMGTDHYYKITKDGLVEKVLGGNNYSTSKFYNNLQIIAQQGVPPYKNNLVVFDGKESKNIGNPHYIYAWATVNNRGGVSPSKDIYRVENDLFLLAIDSTKEKDYSKIYRLNLITDELTLVSNIDTNHFIFEDNTIYFSKGTNLYKIDITGGEPKLLNDELINPDSFQILGGQVYFVNKNNQKLYKIGNDKSLNEYGKVRTLTHQDQYIIATFEEEPENPYRLMIFDSQGDTIFRTSDIPTMVSIDEGLLSYSIDDSGKIFTLRLEQRISGI